MNNLRKSFFAKRPSTSTAQPLEQKTLTSKIEEQFTELKTLFKNLEDSYVKPHERAEAATARSFYASHIASLKALYDQVLEDLLKDETNCIGTLTAISTSLGQILDFFSKGIEAENKLNKKESIVAIDNLKRILNLYIPSPESVLEDKIDTSMSSKFYKKFSPFMGHEEAQFLFIKTVDFSKNYLTKEDVTNISEGFKIINLSDNISEIDKRILVIEMRQLLSEFITIDDSITKNKLIEESTKITKKSREIANDLKRELIINLENDLKSGIDIDKYKFEYYIDISKNIRTIEKYMTDIEYDIENFYKTFLLSMEKAIKSNFSGKALFKDKDTLPETMEKMINIIKETKLTNKWKDGMWECINAAKTSASQGKLKRIGRSDDAHEFYVALASNADDSHPMRIENKSSRLSF